MKLRALIAGLSAVALAFTATACGGDDGDNTKDVEVFTWWADGSEKAGLDALVAEFKKQHPDLNFVNGAVAGGAGSNAKNVLASRLQQQDPPSTFQAHAGAELLDYIEANQLQDVSQLYKENGWDEVFPEDLIELLTVDGKIYSVPSNVHRANVVWANPEVLKKAGLDDKPAKDIDGFIQQLDKLKKAGVDTPLSIATDWTQVHLLETVLIADLGPEKYIGLWDGSTKWDSPEVSKAIDHYAKLLSYTNTDRQNLDWPDATKMVIDGKAGFNIMGDWAEAAFQEADKEWGKDYITYPVPGTDGIFDFLADSFTLPVGAKNEEGTKAWLQTVGSAEGQKAFNIKKGSIPARTDADPKDYGDYQKTALESYKNDTIVPSLAHGAAASVKWSTAITEAVSSFSANKDIEKLKSALVKAAEDNQKKQ
ncbi:ABC transporter substrate-binding protein [Thermocrispum municipale]|jgi:glucose/mannose transport system substrate-binding protein|uniref:ABC transporter substrate-binding protein n=1 Tax=Thermocrispum municipale TaxID=37926 RepID=UPI000401BA1D|nr:ABC transporter substrate-binding protein [Thermocrispum municipale]